MELKEPFTQIPNSMIQGGKIKDMSVIALYCFLRSHSTGFSYNWSNVKKSLNIGKSKYYEALNVLQKYGYIQTEQTKNKNGQFGNTKYLIYGRDYNYLPCIDLPCTDLPYTAEPYTANQYHNNIKSNNKNINNSERESEKNKLSHFDLLKLNYENDVDILLKEYQPKIKDWKFCIEKFNKWNHKATITTIILERWLKDEINYESKNNNQKEHQETNDIPVRKISGF